MKIGVPKEIKPQENRIGLTPESVKTLVSEGHEVIVENDGGFEAGFDNDQYTKAGAKIANSASDIFNDAEIIVKVKEPQKVEVDMIRENQIIYTYLHLAAAKELTEGLIKSKSINIAYETVTDDNSRLPLLAPMSAVAGRMSIQAGAHCLEKNQKGRGLLLGGAPGVVGGTVVKSNPAEIGIMDINFSKEKNEDKLFYKFPTQIKSLQWHSYEVQGVEKNKDVTLLASSPITKYQIFKYQNHAYGIQFHIEIKDTTVSEWGCVPEYKKALEDQLGDGALEKFDYAAKDNMSDMNNYSKILYNNFKKLL